MLDSQTLAMMAEGTGATLYMTLMSTLFGYILGLPMGIILVVTAPKGLAPNQVVYRILDVIVNITRSIPFLILMILIMPFTRILVGKTYGTTATIVPLALAAAPLIAGRGKNLPDCRSNDCTWNDPWIFCNGRNHWRRWSW